LADRQKVRKSIFHPGLPVIRRGVRLLGRERIPGTGALLEKITTTQPDLPGGRNRAYYLRGDQKQEGKSKNKIKGKMAMKRPEIFQGVFNIKLRQRATTTIE